MRVLVEGGIYTLVKETGETRVIQEGEEIAAVAAEFFGPAVSPVPQSVTARQARLALFAFGLLQTLEDAIAALPGPEGDAARIEWEFASDIYRDSPMILEFGPALGMTPEQIDTLFRVAQDL